MSFLQRLTVALQLVAAFAAEMSKLVIPGAEMIVPPMGVQVRTRDADFELRLIVKRVR